MSIETRTKRKSYLPLKTLARTGNRLESPREQVELLSNANRLPGETFHDRLRSLEIHPLRPNGLETLQINVGKVCNQTCSHCHVDAGPDRRESMSAETARHVIEFLSRSQATTLDITGGAPEMNPQFAWLVTEARRLGKQVIDRCNLTILLANGFRHLPEFLAEHGVTVVASLPCYLEENCDAQRGDGVFVKSIEAIRRLNQLGYAARDSQLELNLVYNPVGTGLPPDQHQLEQAYREQLDQRYGIQFNNLFTITNMPISRYLDDLLRQEQYELYMQKLIESFNPGTLDGLMCRTMVSVDWQGYLYDCDFNQMLDLPVASHGRRWHIGDVTDDDLLRRSIVTCNHCYGCTSGGGSSCTGALT